MRIVNIMLLMICGWCMNAWAQMDPVKQQTVEIIEGGNIHQLTATQTQTQLNPGWNVAGIQTGGKRMRYLWGSISRQICDTARPTLVVEPHKSTLSDFILIRLKKKKQYRKMEKPEPLENVFVRITPTHFIVETTEDERFRITPRQDLRPGEYLLMDSSQRPVGDLGDYVGWCFTVKN